MILCVTGPMAAGKNAACSILEEKGFLSIDADLAGHTAAENAKKKIDSKKCDYIIANDISDRTIGFSSDYNEVYIIDKEKNAKKLDKSLKSEIADKIFERIFDENY